MLRNSQVADKKNRQALASGDSPRHRCASRNRRLGAGGSALGSGTPELAGGTYLVRSTDNGGWQSVAASGGQPHGSSNRNSERTGARAGRSAHNLSKDRRDAPDAKGRLAPIAILGNSERGPRGVTAPYWSSLVAKRQLRSEAFLFNRRAFPPRLPSLQRSHRHTPLPAIKPSRNHQPPLAAAAGHKPPLTAIDRDEDGVDARKSLCGRDTCSRSGKAR